MDVQKISIDRLVRHLLVCSLTSLILLFFSSSSAYASDKDIVDKAVKYLWPDGSFQEDIYLKDKAGNDLSHVYRARCYVKSSMMRIEVANVLNGAIQTIVDDGKKLWYVTPLGARPLSGLRDKADDPMLRALLIGRFLRKDARVIRHANKGTVLIDVPTEKKKIILSGKELIPVRVEQKDAVLEIPVQADALTFKEAVFRQKKGSSNLVIERHGLTEEPVEDGLFRIREARLDIGVKHNDIKASGPSTTPFLTATAGPRAVGEEETDTTGRWMDYDDVKRMESVEVTPEQIERFIKEGRLKGAEQ